MCVCVHLCIHLSLCVHAIYRLESAIYTTGSESPPALSQLPTAPPLFWVLPGGPGEPSSLKVQGSMADFPAASKA